MRSKVSVVTLLTVVFVGSFVIIACQGSGPAGPAGGSSPAISSIRQDDLRADLYFLASDAMNGRAAGTRDVAVATEFIKARFQRLGLTPAGPDGSYFQDFDMATAALGDGNSLAIDGVDTAGPRLRVPGQDYYPLNFSATASGHGELVYVGFGIVESRAGYNDYQGADVEGKIVLVLDGEPRADDPESPLDGLVTTENSRDWRKALAAQERGAAGILFVRDVHNQPENVDDYEQASANYWDPRRTRYTLDVWMDRIEIPAARVSAELAERLVMGSGQTLEQLAAGAETDSGHGVLALAGPEIELTAAVERGSTPARNVLAMIEGTDPDVGDEVVILCAHFDHSGSGAGGVLNGADDDGSGTVALLELAEAYAVAAGTGNPPRRTVLFAAWDAEERGLLGAWYYTEAPSFPLGNTVGVINMDMIGRNEEIPEDGGSRFRGYDNNIANLLRRSDQWPFLQVGVPAVFFHTGLHPDYHRHTDTPDLINYPKMEKIARLAYVTSWNLANQEGRPALDRDL